MNDGDEEHSVGTLYCDFPYDTYSLEIFNRVQQCVLDSPYLFGKEGVFYQGKVFIIAEPLTYLPKHSDHGTDCRNRRKISLCVNDCAIGGDCFRQKYGYHSGRLPMRDSGCNERRNFA